MTWCTAYAEVHSFPFSPNKSCTEKYEEKKYSSAWGEIQTLKINLVVLDKGVQEVSKMLEFAQIVSWYITMWARHFYNVGPTGCLSTSEGRFCGFHVFEILHSWNCDWCLLGPRVSGYPQTKTTLRNICLLSHRDLKATLTNNIYAHKIYIIFSGISQYEIWRFDSRDRWNGTGDYHAKAPGAWSHVRPRRARHR